MAHREDDVTRLIGWSTGSRYLAYTNGVAGSDQHVSLTVWSVSDSRRKVFARPGYQIANAVWSPRENRIAFVQIDDANLHHDQ